MIVFTYSPTLVDGQEGVRVVSRTNKEMVFKISIRDFEAGLAKHDAGTYIQDALPQLNNGEREFLISGMTPEEFAEMFPPEEE